MRPITAEKIDLLLQFMTANQLDLLMITDTETSRDINLRYLSGHPMDASVIFTNSGETILLPWDLKLANDMAEVDRILDYVDYGYSPVKMYQDLFTNIIKKPDALIGVTNSLTYQTVTNFQQYLPDLRFFPEPIKVTKFLNDLRSTKTERELDLLTHAAKIADQTIPAIRKFAESAESGTEKDLSFLVQAKMSKGGAEDVAFPPLVANATRSHFLHCHPWATEAPFAHPGFSLIDYGAKYNGYNSDVTVSFTFGPLDSHHTMMQNVVERAYTAAVETIDIGVPLWKINQAAEEILTQAGFSMPYALGHGLGLSEHDSPFISKKPVDQLQQKYWEEICVTEGHVFTIEPGVYQAGYGGLRIENDFMIRHGKVVQLTHSQVFSIP